MNENEQFFLNSNEVLCPKCGAICIEEHLFCAVCGSALKSGANVSANASGNFVPNGNGGTQENENGFVIWLVLAFVTPGIGLLLATMVHPLCLELATSVSLFSIIYARVKYNNNKIVKTFFVIYIIFFILVMIALAIFTFMMILACAEVMKGCQGLG